MANKPNMRSGRPPMKKGTLKRLFQMLFKFYPVALPLTLLCILFSAVVAAIPSIFMQKVVALVEVSLGSGSTWSAVSGQFLRLISVLLVFYLASLVSSFAWNRMMAIITQGTLKKLRCAMFDGMQDLPIRYFDTHNHGDIMSHYTNDIDTLRQLIAQSIPQLISTAVVVISVLCIMLYYSLWLTLVVLLGVYLMTFIIRGVGGKSGKFFRRQQEATGKMEGFVEELMNGQKVVKVFVHEEETKKDFDRFNDGLYDDSRKANTFANILMPILFNLSNVLYAVVAMVGGALMLAGAPNVSISCLPFSISIIVPFLNMTKQFSNNISQVSQQFNSIIMGIAGAQRIFDLMEEQPERDEGHVTLVNACENPDGTLTECAERTNVWAWRDVKADGTVTYNRLTGDVRFQDVDFGYSEDKTVLHDITLFAEPGQKVAFVGATGAGKTTITNLINRFYDIQDGTILYDGINIKEIRKADLRRSLGIVLQDTNLFTGTVMDNIRYGNLDACDDECIAAAQLAGAHDFITRLPDGYNTMLTGNGASLSQGQRQLLAIARAAVADPPVLILDEATSSIDTRTEAIVQAGMDALMCNRTVFVIAHRLSTVRNSDVIMVLEQGRIIERGNHEKLIAEKGEYYQLYTGAFELE
ncbi:MAG: ABC transporter ATP-binding protein [Oscillospiraceae bacterium]|nr:ABC transporter ATP-binding protein [Oscillospiraceae bacterium]